MIAKTCPICGGAFEAFSDRKIYCSIKCQNRYYYCKANPESKLVREKTCTTCFKPFLPTHHKQVTCQPCKDAIERAKQAARLANERQTMLNRMSKTEMGHLPKKIIPVCTINQALAMSPTTATTCRIVSPDKKTIIYPRSAERFELLQKQAAQ